MKVSDVVFAVDIALIVAYVVFVIMNLAGFVYPVSGVSMYPLLKTGYLAFVKPVNVSSVRVGQIVVYYNPFSEKYVIHMVVMKVNDGLIVKGYNNLTNPYPDINQSTGLPLVVTQSLLKGVVVFYMPYLGYALLRPYSFVLVFILLAVAIVVEELDRKRLPKASS